MNQSLGTRFVAAYNLLDYSLRTQYNFKINISFSDLIRRCSSLNQVIRTYEDELIDLARLRNAIIHNRSEQVIAEPHEDVVELIEKIAQMISTPPLAIDAIKGCKVDTINAQATIKEFILISHRVGHSNIPVYKNNVLIGVLKRDNVIFAMGTVLENGNIIENFISNTTIEQFLRDFPNNAHFTITSAKITIEEVLTLFNQNRKLSSVIITKDGTADSTLLGIITAADFLDLMKVLEGF